MPSSAGHLASRLRSGLLFAPLYGLATIGYGAVSMACSLVDRSGRRQHRVAQAWARMLLRLARVRVAVEGLDHLPVGDPSAAPAWASPGPEPARAPAPANLQPGGAQAGRAPRPSNAEESAPGEARGGPRPSFVMVCNHLSYMDVPVLFATLPLQFRILARQGLFRIPFLGGHLKRAQHLPVDQSNPRASLRSLQSAAAAVAAGLPLFIFPEAGRSFSGAMRPFVPGAFHIAIQAQVPVVPMVLVGTYEILPPATAHLRPGAVELVICPPVATAGLDRRQAPQLADQVRATMLAVYESRRGLLQTR
jgi:1-acyl-sn-glycerol-3-phosphate acyltransferase